MKSSTRTPIERSSSLPSVEVVFPTLKWLQTARYIAENNSPCLRASNAIAPHSPLLNAATSFAKHAKLRPEYPAP
jgi:hypothetical protein